ncbi:MAG: hypothetical protein QOH28_1049 [Actinomycetota bacterium]|nr:hypothetical protein [Actinomycetota bacterium]
MDWKLEGKRPLTDDEFGLSDLHAGIGDAHRPAGGVSTRGGDG